MPKDAASSADMNLSLSIASSGKSKKTDLAV
jgi:hypothetical protein